MYHVRNCHQPEAGGTYSSGETHLHESLYHGKIENVGQFLCEWLDAYFNLVRGLELRGRESL